MLKEVKTDENFFGITEECSNTELKGDIDEWRW